ncbi:MAG: hypothetical protein HY868_17895 [Chloroflexi bacterium]|nr:hypothetical protein [Chloroflexota bacterium]
MRNEFYGLTTRTLENEHLRVEFLTDAGPRIVRLCLRGSEENWLAEVPDSRVATARGDYFFRGGHRLWYTPEQMPQTYQPENTPVTIEELADGVCLHQPIELMTGIRKSMAIRLARERAALTLTHRIENTGNQAIELAPWAITMLRLGRIAILPQMSGAGDEHSLLPNRNLVLWSYTRLDDSRLELSDDAVRVHARPQVPPCKIGHFNRAGWIAYWRAGVLFVKRFAVHANAPHPDLHCNAAVYCNDKYLELETLAPITRLACGESATHEETWEFYPSRRGQCYPINIGAMAQGVSRN